MQPKTRCEWDQEMKSGRLHGRPPNPASKQGLKSKQEPIQNLSHSCSSLAFLSLSGDLLLCRFTAMAPYEMEWTPRNIDADRCYLDMDLEDDITHYISSDNAEGLKSLLSHQDVRTGTYSYCRTTLLQSLCLFSALKCATALVDGKLGVRVDVNRNQLLHHYAARFSSPELVKLFLRYGARTDVRYARKVWWGKGMLPLNGMLPLDTSLYAARELVYSYQQESLFKWIVFLCLPSLKPSLVVNKLSQKPSNSVTD